jgi:exonuclease VII large subunit
VRSVERQAIAADRRNRLAQLVASLEALSPQSVLAHGYSLSFKLDAPGCDVRTTPSLTICRKPPSLWAVCQEGVRLVVEE